MGVFCQLVVGPPTEIQKAIRLQNIQLSTGSLGDRPTSTPQSLKLTLLTTGRLKTAEEFGNIIVRANSDGSLVRLYEVARVELGAVSYVTGPNNLSSIEIVIRPLWRNELLINVNALL